MRKLIGFIPTKEKRYCFGNVIRNAKKEKDSALFLVLDTIDVATQQKKKIEFDYMTKDGTLSRLIQTPLEIHHVNNSYYVVCLNFDTKQIVRYLLKNNAISTGSSIENVNDYIPASPVIDYRIEGNSYQEKFPTLNEAQSISFVGNPVSDTDSKYFGKYHKCYRI